MFLIAHAGGGLKEHKLKYLNSKEGFLIHYKKGIRVFEFDLMYTSDNEIIATPPLYFRYIITNTNTMAAGKVIMNEKGSSKDISKPNTINANTPSANALVLSVISVGTSEVFVCRLFTFVSSFLYIATPPPNSQSNYYIP